MIKVLLILVFVTADGAHLVAVQPFERMTACEAELMRLVPRAKGALPPGQLYALDCVLVESAGVES